MKKRSTLYIFLSLLFSLVLIGTAFSTFVFPTADKLGEHDDDADGFIDDIDNNYTLDANAYTVYFFSSPGWAYYIKNTTRKEGQSMSDYLSVDNYLSYVKNDLSQNQSKYKVFGTSTITDSSLKKIGYFPDDDADRTGTYGYRIRYADTCISSATFEEVPKPTTTGRDKFNYKLLFIGWTASLQSAMSYGYHSQGEYNYVSAYDELSLLDNKDNDNIDEANKVIYLFPVFTAGKDYEPSNNIYETAVRIHDRNTVVLKNDDGVELDYSGGIASSTGKSVGVYFSNELYFSHSGTKNTGYYSYKNLNVRENEQYYLDFDFAYGSSAWSGWWRNFWDVKCTSEEGLWEGELLNTSGYSTDKRSELKPLFDTTGKNKKEDHKCAVDEPGIYNIYVYVHWDSSGSNSWSDDYSSSNISSEFENITIGNTSLVWYEDPKDSTHHVMTWVNGGNYSVAGGKYKVYVKIEKIVEIGLAGGRTKSLEYEFSQQLNKSNITPTQTGTSTSTSAVSSRYYLANNVFMEGDKIKDTISSYNTETQGQYQYSSDISMIVGNDDEPIPITKVAYDSEALATFNKNYQSVYKNPIYDFTDATKNKYDIYKNNDVIDKENGITSKNLPFTPSSSDSSEYYIRPVETGFYSVAVRMDVTTTRSTAYSYSGNKGEQDRFCTVTFSSCEIALAFGKSVFSSIYLYTKGTTIKTSDGKFIDTTEDTGNWYARCVERKVDGEERGLKYGESLSYDTWFQVKTTTGTGATKLEEKQLKDLLTSGTTSYHLTNHLTGREFRFDSSNKSNPLRRSYAFYLMPGDWKEGEIPKNTTK